MATPGARSLPLARGRRLALDRPLVMGILNATPDSFSDGGRLSSPEAVEARVRRMLADGADVLDVGGESTRPGHVPVEAAEEVRRVVPVIAAIRRIAPAAVVSVDTSKAAVAEAALAAGADLINDVSALGDAGMAAVVREAGCAVVLMRHRPLQGADVVAAARQQLDALVAGALAQGLPESALVVDPGIGFGDPPGGDVEANLALLRSSRRLSGGRPVLVGASRKRFLGTITGEAVADRRVGASVAAAVLAVEGGADLVRVHDVAETAQALRVLARGTAARPD
jgi:dihydropteroate synthase